MARRSKTKKNLQQTPPQKRGGFAMNSSPQVDEIRQRVIKFSSVIRTLTHTLNTVQPRHDPFELIAYENTWHSRCLRAKVNSLVGQGYDASASLRAHIDKPNSKYSMQALLRKTCRDYVEHGNMFVESVRGVDTVGMFHSPAIKTRIRYDVENDEKLYVKFEFEWQSSWLGYMEMPELASGVKRGMKQLANCDSDTGSDFYGDPTWIDGKPLLRMNWNIIKSANRFFDHSLISDLAIIEKGMGRSDEDIDAIKDYIGDHMAGADNAHKILYMQVATDEDIKFEKLQSDFQGKETTNVRLANREEIIVVHDMYPRLVGVIDAGSWGGGPDLEAQLMAYRQFYADPEQYLIEAWWQDLFEELGLPDAKSFKLKPMNITTGDTDMKTLATGVQSGILSTDEAKNSWMVEKRAKSLIQRLREMKEELV